MSNIIDTRDLYKRQQELQDLKYAVGNAEEALQEAQDDLAAHSSEISPDDSEEEQEDHAEKTEELEEAVSDAEEALADAQNDFGPDEQTELEELNDLENEVGGEWQHGETMIPEDKFEDYARQFAEDIGALKGVGDKWPCTCIDWEQAAKELAMDYTTVTYQGTEYLVRA